MAIDSSLFGAVIPAGSYSVGDIIPMGIIAGPANVRSGRGVAILKRIVCGTLVSPNDLMFRVHVKNSDWIDEATSIAASIANVTSMDDNSSMVQPGNDSNLTINSGWQIYAECVNAGTSTQKTSVFALIDIDYPQVSSIADPYVLPGEPTSITMDLLGASLQDPDITAASWTVKNVDYFKAGYQYCLQAVEMYANNVAVGFISFSNAAGMGGLSRIIPIYGNALTVRSSIHYASKLVKGPMDVKFMMFSTAAGTANLFLVHDYVKAGA